FDFDTALGYSGPEDPGAIMTDSGNVRVINCKDVVHSHGGYRSAGEVWSYMSGELAHPSKVQFVTLVKTPQALNAVFRVAGRRAAAGRGTGGRSRVPAAVRRAVAGRRARGGSFARPPPRPCVDRRDRSRAVRAVRLTGTSCARGHRVE